MNALMLNEFAVVEGSFIHQCYAQSHKFFDMSFALRCVMCNSMGYIHFNLALEILVSEQTPIKKQNKKHSFSMLYTC